MEKEELIKEKAEMIKNMLSSGLSAEQISHFTGLTIDEIAIFQN